MAIVEAPFSYALTYVAPRSSKPKTIEVRDTTPVTVREVGAAEAPVAARAKKSDGNKVVDYRWHDGQLWQPVQEISPLTPLANLADTNAVGDKHNPLLPRGAVLREEREEKHKVQYYRDVPVKQVVETNRDAGAAAAQTRANEILVVNGVLHELSQGPVFTLRPTKNDNSHATLIVTDIYADDVFPALVFRGDEREKAIAIAEATFRKSPSVDCDDAEILIPEAFTANMSDLALVMAARSVFKDQSAQITLGSLPSEYLEAWLDYTHPDFDRENASEDLESLLTRVRDALKGNKDSDLRSIGRMADAVLLRRAAEREMGYLSTPDEAPMPA